MIYVCAAIFLVLTILANQIAVLVRELRIGQVKLNVLAQLIEAQSVIEPPPPPKVYHSARSLANMPDDERIHTMNGMDDEELEDAEDGLEKIVAGVKAPPFAP